VTPYQLTRFSEFPLELRLIIWCLAAREPRDIKLLFLHLRIPDNTDRTNSKVPSILHTSKEARQAGLRYYQVIYEKVIGRGRDGTRGYLWPYAGSTTHRRGVYVNFYADTFYHEALSRKYFNNQSWVPKVCDYNFNSLALSRIRYVEFRIPLIRDRILVGNDFLKLGNFVQFTVSISKWWSRVLEDRLTIELDRQRKDAIIRRVLAKIFAKWNIRALLEIRLVALEREDFTPAPELANCSFSKPVNDVEG